MAKERINKLLKPELIKLAIAQSTKIKTLEKVIDDQKEHLNKIDRNLFVVWDKLDSLPEQKGRFKILWIWKNFEKIKEIILLIVELIKEWKANSNS